MADGAWMGLTDEIEQRQFLDRGVGLQCGLVGGGFFARWSRGGGLEEFRLPVHGRKSQPVVRVAAPGCVDGLIGLCQSLCIDYIFPAYDDIIIARVDADLCVKKLRIEPDGQIWLLSENKEYAPIAITEAMDFEVWGRVMYAIQNY